jgi:hypothetical protein
MSAFSKFWSLFKYRLTGAAGAPASLNTNQVAFNHVDGNLYIGVGNVAGSETASAVVAIAGSVKADAAATEAALATKADGAATTAALNTKADAAATTAALATKAAAANVYTKAEVDAIQQSILGMDPGLLSNLTAIAAAFDAEASEDASTLAVVNASIADKAAAADVYTKTQTYTQAEVDALIASVTGAAMDGGTF